MAADDLEKNASVWFMILVVFSLHQHQFHFWERQFKALRKEIYGGIKWEIITFYSLLWPFWPLKGLAPHANLTGKPSKSTSNLVRQFVLLPSRRKVFCSKSRRRRCRCFKGFQNHRKKWQNVQWPCKCVQFTSVQHLLFTTLYGFFASTPPQKNVVNMSSTVVISSQMTTRFTRKVETLGWGQLGKNACFVITVSAF